MKCPRCGKDSENMRICNEEIMCEQCYQDDDIVGMKALLRLKQQAKKVKGSLKDEG